jgi:hypothetical protein
LANNYPAYAEILAENSWDKPINIEVQQQTDTQTGGRAIGVAIENLNVSGLPPEDAFIQVLREPLDSLFDGGFNEQIVVLVDAVDESVRSGREVNILSLLADANNLPPSVRFIVTSRPGPFLRPLQRSSSELSLNSSIEDARLYVSLALDQMSDLKGKLDPHVLPNDFAAAVAERSEGNMLLVNQVLQSLAAADEKVDLSFLEDLDLHQPDEEAPKTEFVPTHPDRPAQVDELGRMAFAEALAMRIRRMRNEDRKSSFMLHLHGPWGSGKTSLLYFISQELKKKDPSPWVVVEFNAWQHQRIGPPWWWLLDVMFRQGVRQLFTIQLRNTANSTLGTRTGTFLRMLWDWARALWLLLFEHTWRFLRAGRAPYLLALTAIFGSIWLTDLFGLFSDPTRQADSTSIMTLIRSFANEAKDISGILTLITGIWAVILGISRSLLPASARAAQTFMESARDPMQTLTHHFNHLVAQLGYDVAILIDDLDRCQSSYVIELLEGIQTLFREAPVAYVVAADRRWICTSYEKGYEAFAGQVQEPGRPLGHLFLEKTFQLSTSVPRMSLAAQGEYWKRLIDLNQSTNRNELRGTLEEARRRERQRFQGLRTEAQIRQALQDSSDEPITKQASREEAVIRLGSPEVQASTEHMLKPFAELLEPNPRAMKRLVNAYGVTRAIDWLAGGNTDGEQLALWTIIDLRWPLLAEYLAENPGVVTYLEYNSLPNAIPEHLHELFRDQAVRDVIKGRGVGTSLDEDAIRACTS